MFLKEDTCLDHINTAAMYLLIKYSYKITIVDYRLGITKNATNSILTLYKMVFKN